MTSAKGLQLGRDVRIHALTNLYDSSIGDETKIAAFVEIGGAVIGARCKIQAFAFIPPGVVIEDEVFIGPHVCFTNDRYPRAVGPWRCEPSRVRRGASIGAAAVILPGVTIGAGAAVAAGAVVDADVPAGYLFEGSRDSGRLKPWYRSQEAVGLPLTFDQWRRDFDRLSYREHLDFYDAVFERFPEQKHCSLHEVRRFFHGIPGPMRVLEIGGWDGRIAEIMLEEFPQIAGWHNLEVCRRAVAAGLRDPRYKAEIPDAFFCDLLRLPPHDVFFAALCVEHMRSAQLARLLDGLHETRWAYVEAPLPESATDVCWSGRWNTHVLEIGWEQVEALFVARGFAVRHMAPNVRFFAR